MINVLIPMVGKSIFFEESSYVYPKPLIEVKGQPMIQRVIENLDDLGDDVRYIFLVNSQDCRKYHIDSVLKLLTNDKALIISVEKSTAGAACTALLAIDHINNDDPLIISNADQYFDVSLADNVKKFQQRGLDAATICFESVHPRWSYVATDEDGNIVEASEKKPISKHAIAGIFYYKHGKDFVGSAMKSIYKDASINGAYYIAPIFNEMVLDGKRLGLEKVPNKDYHTFYSPQLLEEYNRGSTDD